MYELQNKLNVITNTLVLRSLQSEWKQLHVFIIKPQVCVHNPVGYEYSYIWGIRPIKLFLRFSGCLDKI